MSGTSAGTSVAASGAGSGAGAGAATPAGTPINLVQAFAVQSPAAMLRELADAAAADSSVTRDVYGTGTSLNALEAECAALVGKPAAVMCVSGVMAQLIALAVARDATRETGRDVREAFVMHPTCHLELHENKAYRELLGMSAVFAGDKTRAMRAADLQAVAAPTSVASAIVELPQRVNGGETMPWDDVLTAREWATANGVALHMDGARLFEVCPYYGKSPAEVAAPFDTVYFSFYKGLGGMVGAMLCGSEAFVAKARIWLRRFGGNLYTQLPYEVAARKALRARLDSFNARFTKIKEVVAAVSAALVAAGNPARLRFVPEVPQATMIHTYFGAATPEEVMAAADDVATASGIRAVTRVRPSAHAPAAAVADAEGLEMPSCTEWNMGTANLAIPTEIFVKGWVQFGAALAARVAARKA